VDSTESTSASKSASGPMSSSETTSVSGTEQFRARPRIYRRFTGIAVIACLLVVAGLVILSPIGRPSQRQRIFAVVDRAVLGTVGLDGPSVGRGQARANARAPGPDPGSLGFGKLGVVRVGVGFRTSVCQRGGPDGGGRPSPQPQHPPPFPAASATPRTDPGRQSSAEPRRRLLNLSAVRRFSRGASLPEHPPKKRS